MVVIQKRQRSSRMAQLALFILTLAIGLIGVAQAQSPNSQPYYPRQHQDQLLYEQQQADRRNREQWRKDQDHRSTEERGGFQPWTPPPSSYTPSPRPAPRYQEEVPSRSETYTPSWMQSPY